MSKNLISCLLHIELIVAIKGMCHFLGTEGYGAITNLDCQSFSHLVASLPNIYVMAATMMLMAQNTLPHLAK